MKERPLKDLKQKILVVDDEKMIRWSLGEALRGWGYEPIQAETASAGLAAFEAESACGHSSGYQPPGRFGP